MQPTQWKWIVPQQERALPEPPRPPFGAPPEPAGENIARLRPAQYIRKSFVIHGPIKKATAYATAHGLYRLYVNGSQADDRVLAPEVTPFDKLLTYQTYDVTPLLRQGENAIGAIVTDGWHIGRIGLTGDACQYADMLALLLQLDIQYADGGSETIASDASFTSHTGALAYSDLFIGEQYDARLEPTGWNQPGFAAEGWRPVQEAAYPEELRPQAIPPTRMKERFAGRKILTPAGEMVYDMGQVLAGIPQLRVMGEAGARITLQHSEALDGEGNFFNNINGRNKEQTDVYILRGDPKGEEYRPIGTYHGFRYVKATCEGEATIQALDAYAIRTDLAETASFQCSDGRLNRLWDNVLWSLRGNTISLPTDCPQRERSGFTGDLAIFIRAACTLMDMREFVRSWLDSLRLEQTKAGEVPIIVPNFPGLERMQRGMSGTNCSSGWGDAVVLVPWAMYQFYGDRAILRENYAAMKGWLGFVERWAATGEPNDNQSLPLREGHARYLWNTGFHFGDWLVPSRGKGMGSPFASAEETKGPIGTAYFAQSSALLSQIAKELGEREDAAYYGALSENIRQAYRKEYLPDGHLRSDYQGVYVTAIAFDMLTKAQQADAAQRLVDMIRENDGCLDTGFLSVSHIMDALCKAGHRQEAYKLLFQTKCPSWLYEVEMGATTIWESWNAILPDGTVNAGSLNHYAFGCVVDWMMRAVVGLQSDAPGFASIRIRPGVESGLAYAKGHYQSIHGRIAIGWSIVPEGVRLEADIPEGVTALLEWGGEECPLAPGKQIMILTHQGDDR